MQNVVDDIKSMMRANMILFYALVIGVMIFLIIITGILQFLKTAPLEDKNMSKIFLFTSCSIAILCFVFGTMAYKKRLSKTINSNSGLIEKINQYREAMIIYLAACEGAALFATICLFLTGNYWVIVIAITMLTAMWFRMPTKQRLITDLQLSSQEQQEL
jgi:hypothetical protein